MIFLVPIDKEHLNHMNVDFGKNQDFGVFLLTFEIALGTFDKKDKEILKFVEYYEI